MIGLAVPIRVVFMKHKMCEPLLRIGIHPLDVGLRNPIPPSSSQGFFEDWILLGIGLDFALTGIVDDVASLEDRIEPLCTDL